MRKKIFKTFVQTALFFSLTTFSSVQAYEEYLTYDTHVATDNPESGHLILEDGSEWKVSDMDLDELQHWFAHSALAPVVINPNYGSGKNYYGYYLTNQDTGSYVKANLVGAPLRENTKTVTILGLEKSSFNRGCVYLSNGTFWCVSHADLKLLKNWHMNDLVIIGKNTEWFSYDTHILINVEANTFVRAQRI